MRGSRGVRGRLGALIALGTLVVALCGAAPATAQPARVAQTSGGSITGHVTDASTGLPVSGVTVTATNAENGQWTSVSSGTDGVYTFSGLAPSSYTIYFVDSAYLTQYWNGKAAAAGDPISVSDGQTVTGIDAALQPAGSITGHITDASTGTPPSVLSQAGVMATNSATGESTSTTLDVDGTYTFNGLPLGSYTIEFSAVGYATQWWNSKPSQATADEVTLATAGQTASNIDAALTPIAPATISGTVTNSAGQPIAGATVTPTCEPNGVNPTTTAADGTYTLSIQPTSTGETCTVAFSATGYLSQSSNNEINVSAGQTVTGVDAALQQAGSITGRVIDASTGAPLSGVTVTVTGTNGFMPSVSSGPDGTYTFIGLTPGTYTVEFSDSDYVTQWWNDKPNALSDLINVSAGQTVTGIDAALQPAGSITGQVTDASTGTPLSGVSVTARNSTTGELTNVHSGGDGTYTFTGIATGTYTVEFDDFSYFTQWWNNTSSQATADNVTVTQGQTASTINAALVPSAPAAISGKVTNSAGQPVAGATVVAACPSSNPSVSSTTTASDGTYTINGFTPPSAGDTCHVGFFASGYVTQYRNDKTVPLGDPIRVSDGQKVSGIDAVLQPAASLSGVVSAASGASSTPLVGATVVVHNYYGFTVAQTTTAADGSWSVGNLGGGVYRVEFQPPAGSGLLGQWWNNEPDGAHSDRVGLAAGGAVGNINATLTLGAAVSGTVTDAAGPVAGARVGVFSVNSSSQPGTEVAHTTTAADGTYRVSGLQAGNYDVLFDPPAGSVDVGQWYNNSPTADNAADVALSLGGTATANAQLTTGQRGSISGTVTDQAGSPIAGSTVLAVAADGRTTTTATTAADGSYTVANLDVGIDTVWFLPPAGSSYGASVWNLAVGKIVAVTVDQGSAITGINATLAQN